MPHKKNKWVTSTKKKNKKQKTMGVWWHFLGLNYGYLQVDWITIFFVFIILVKYNT